MHGLYSLYILGDQVLVLWGHSGQNRHLGLFGALTVLPDQRGMTKHTAKAEEERGPKRKKPWGYLKYAKDCLRK